ncbi:unnamed protein product [Didymodactylos carnosus]|uniref:Uncharacterized protein n=1 Tax=Didymodactylos carnosus TaxID=1234261 RepID=A0A814ZG48_9BILA|nr:unnamed protein product [Didymodactylos carnosus]CAF4006451.1 unnamed protein product [Didymodactylos carnosus]
MPDVQCCKCGKWKNKQCTRDISSDSYEWIREKLNITNTSVLNYYICSTCERDTRRKSTIVVDASNSTSDFEIQLEEYLFMKDCHHRCCICGVILTSSSVVIPSSARIDLLVDHHLYVNYDTRVCDKHLCKNRLSTNISINKKTCDPLSLDGGNLKSLILDLISNIREVRTKVEARKEDFVCF